jgi:hypothetical protein
MRNRMNEVTTISASPEDLARASHNFSLLVEWVAAGEMFKAASP